MKNRKMILSLLLKMLIGGIVGGLVSFVWITLVEDTGFVSQGDQWYTRAKENIIWLQIILAAGLTLFGASRLVAAKGLLKALHLDEENDELEFAFDSKVTWSLFSSQLLYISNFFLFGLGQSVGEGMHYLLKVGIFLLIVFASISIEILSIRLVQKKDPHREADPASLKFNEQWLDACDEAERIVIYKSAYRSFVTLQIALIVAMCVTFFAKMFSDISDFTLYIVAGLWLVHTVTYYINAMKLNKQKIEI